MEHLFSIIDANILISLKLSFVLHQNLFAKSRPLIEFCLKIQSVCFSDHGKLLSTMLFQRFLDSRIHIINFKKNLCVRLASGLDLLQVSLFKERGKGKNEREGERLSRSLPFFPFSLFLKRETCSKSTSGYVTKIWLMII